MKKRTIEMKKTYNKNEQTDYKNEKKTTIEMKKRTIKMKKTYYKDEKTCNKK